MHPVTAAPSARPHPRTALHRPEAATHRSAIQQSDASPTHYVFAPKGLLQQFARDPACVAIWLVVARQSMIQRGAVPISRADLIAFFSDTLSEGSAKRRIDKLLAAGWLAATRASKGEKQRLIPSWGNDASGVCRPWSWEQRDLGRPAHVRAARVDITVIDHLLGRLEPKPGRMPAVITRYFTTPLLTPADLGTYAIAWYVTTIPPTPRLQALGLLAHAGDTPRAPRPLQALLVLAMQDRLHDADGTPIRPTVHGWDRLGLTPPCDDSALAAGAVFFGPLSGSVSESITRSVWGQQPIDLAGTNGRHFTASERAGTALDIVQREIAWEDMESRESEPTKSDPPPHMLSHANGGGGHILTLEECSGDVRRSAPQQPTFSDIAFSQLDPALRAGHLALNPRRQILGGEWLELLALQQEIGAAQILRWQAKAGSAAAARPQGVTVGYYRACARRAAVDEHRPARHAPARDIERAPEPGAVVAPCPHCAGVSRGDVPTSRSAGRAAPAPALDPEVAALLRTMGVREPELLAGVDVGLVREWQAVIAHPGLAARFDDPVAFAVSQLRRGNAPPAVAELDRWNLRQMRRDDPHESWRHIQAPEITPEDRDAHERLVERAEAINPYPDDQTAHAYLMCYLEDGLTEAEALAHLEAQWEKNRQIEVERTAAREAQRVAEYGLSGSWSATR